MIIAHCTLLLLAAAAIADEEEATCPASGPCNDALPAGEEYWWPHSRGHPGRYGSTTLHGPLNLTDSLVWQWQHPKYQVMPGAVLLDAAKNIYAPSLDGVRKFSPDGKILWHHERALAHSCPSLMGGALYGSTKDGYVYALDMETADVLWNVRHAVDSTMDTPYVEAHDGMVFTIFDTVKTPTSGMAGNVRVVAMNASNGDRLWEYMSETVLWNFHPMFVGDGSFLVMDIHGGVFKIRMRDGEVLWRKQPPGLEYTFTDGGVILGPGNDAAYACSNLASGFSEGGTLRAYRVSDGQEIWEQDLPQPCVSWPAVGNDNSTVVVPVGALPFPVPPQAVLIALGLMVYACFFCLRFVCCGRLRSIHRTCALFLLMGPLVVHAVSLQIGPRLWKNEARPLEVLAFDALTGEKRWTFKDIEPWPWVTARGDEELFLLRIFVNLARPVCGPASWSAPTVDGRGTVYVAAMNGLLYAIRDADGDGVIATSEVSTLDLGAASLHAGSSFAPGMMAFASCSGIFVFRT